MIDPATDGETRPPPTGRLSALIHGTAAILSAAGMAALLWSLPTGRDGRSVFAVAIYGASLVLAFASSAAYHGSRRWRRNWVMAMLDHCAIFILIAGTYTPFGLVALRGRGGLALTGIEWSLAALGVLARLFWIRRLHRLSIPIYVTMGWLGLAWYRPLLDTIGPAGLALIVAGGVAYTSGIAAYRWRRLRYSNELWHGFVVVGAALHFCAVALTVPFGGVAGGGGP
jgi:hemolysin III